MFRLAGITSPPPNLSLDYGSSSPTKTYSPSNMSPPSQSSELLSPLSASSSQPISREPSSDRPIRSDSYPSQKMQDPPDRSTRADSYASQTSINDLTELLGGAIDEIGLIDSRETPPPMIAADKKDKPKSTNNHKNLSLSSLGSVPSDDQEKPITPGSLPTREGSLSSASGSGISGTVPPPNPPTAHHERQTSISTLHAPTTAVQIGNRPWPAAMLFGHIKNMKHSGDRAKYYAKGINELAVADSGLRDWCIVSGKSAFSQVDDDDTLTVFSLICSSPAARSHPAPSPPVQSHLAFRLCPIYNYPACLSFNAPTPFTRSPSVRLFFIRVPYA